MEYYTARDLAQLMHLRQGRIYELIAAGHVPGLHIGKRVLCPRPAFEQWLASQTAQALANVKMANVETHETAGAH